MPKALADLLYDRGRLERHLTHDFAGRPRLHQLVGLPRPQVEPVGVATLAGGRPQRARDVVDLGVRERRDPGVLGQEPVHDPPRRAPGERPGDARRTTLGQQRALSVRGSGLGRQHQRRADLAGACAGAEHGGP